MNKITDELLRQQRQGLLSKRRRFLRRRNAVKGSSGVSTQLTKAAAQSSPTNTSPVNFTLTFLGPVTGFTAADVQTSTSTVGGTLTPTVTGGPTTYNIAIAGATGNGNITCSVPAGAGLDALGNPTPASNTATVVLDTLRPSVTINSATSQSDPTSTSPILFTVVFSETVTGFTSGDVTLSGTATGLSAVVSGSGPTYTVSVTGMTAGGTVIASIPANAATDLAGNLSFASTSTDNTVTWVAPPFGVTINQAAGQADPTNASPILFTAVFAEAVTGFTGADISFTGSTTTGTLVAAISGTGPTYTVSVSGMNTAVAGNVVASIPAGGVTGVAFGNTNSASTSTDNSVGYDAIRPQADINRALSQTDPTSISPIRFFIGWNEPVIGFDETDISFTGTTAGGTLIATVVPSGTTYDLWITGMTTNGEVVASIPANVCTDLAGNLNLASMSTADNSVTWTGGGGGGGFPDSTTSANEFPILFV